MGLFSKFFGGPHDAMLRRCKLLVVRESIMEYHRFANAEAERRGGSHLYPPEYVRAWNAFRDQPTVGNARTLLEIAPQYLLYFEDAGR